MTHRTKAAIGVGVLAVAIAVASVIAVYYRTEAVDFAGKFVTIKSKDPPK